jgi:hypothetical protein
MLLDDLWYKWGGKKTYMLAYSRIMCHEFGCGLWWFDEFETANRYG